MRQRETRHAHKTTEHTHKNEEKKNSTQVPTFLQICAENIAHTQNTAAANICANIYTYTYKFACDCVATGEYNVHMYICNMHTYISCGMWGMWGYARCAKNLISIANRARQTAAAATAWDEPARAPLRRQECGAGALCGHILSGARSQD